MIEQSLILLQIIFIDIILAADNAIIIGLIAANFVPKNRKKIIFWGVVGALVFKVIFAIFATYLFKFYFIKILGGLLLIWIVNDLRKDLFEIQKIKSPKKKSMEPSFIKSIYKVLFADITISFDNVIGVVGAAKGNFGFMIFGLVLSVVLTGALATYLANYIQKHLWIAYIGLAFIFLVAIQLIISGLADFGMINIPNIIMNTSWMNLLTGINYRSSSIISPKSIPDDWKVGTSLESNNIQFKPEVSEYLITNSLQWQPFDSWYLNFRYGYGLAFSKFYFDKDTESINEKEWIRNQTLHRVKNGIILIPRSPTNTWNMWHQDHIDPLLNRAIQNMIMLYEVNPNKVYLMGYSAGGDGVYQLAPRMADRFAAAAMMAGHPNETSPLGLRNLPFTIHMGENDLSLIHI